VTTLENALRGVSYALWAIGDGTSRFQVNSTNQLGLMALYEPDPRRRVIVEGDMIIDANTGEVICEEVKRG